MTEANLRYIPLALASTDDLEKGLAGCKSLLVHHRNEGLDVKADEAKHVQDLQRRHEVVLSIRPGTSRIRTEAV